MEAFVLTLIGLMFTAVSFYIGRLTNAKKEGASLAIMKSDIEEAKGLPEIIATQQRQIDEINTRLGRGNVKFDTLEKDVTEIKTELASNNVLLYSMDMKLEILVSAQMGVHQSKEDIELLNEAYRVKKLEQLKK